MNRLRTFDSVVEGEVVKNFDNLKALKYLSVAPKVFTDSADKQEVVKNIDHLSKVKFYSAF
jgi:hypothetical protein